MANYYRKPIGWRSESYRHYLAAKGIRTRMRYYAKGNYGDPILHSLHAQGVTTEQAVAAGVVSPAALQRRQRPKVIDAAQLQIPSATQMMGLPEENPITSFAPLPQEPIPQLESAPQLSTQPLSNEPELDVVEEPQQEVSKPSNVAGTTELTPGVPPDMVGFDNMS